MMIMGVEEVEEGWRMGGRSPAGSMVLPLVLLPNTESKSTWRPRALAGGWGAEDAENPVVGVQSVIQHISQQGWWWWWGAVRARHAGSRGEAEVGQIIKKCIE